LGHVELLEHIKLRSNTKHGNVLILTPAPRIWAGHIVSKEAMHYYVLYFLLQREKGKIQHNH